MITSLQKKVIFFLLIVLFAMNVSVTPSYAAAKRIKLSTIKTIRVGHYKTFKAKTSPKKYKVIWKTSNRRIAKVSSTGKVTALKPGTVTITARIKGTRIKKRRKIIIYKLKKSSTIWVAHKGYKGIENTKEAFTNAGKAGFHGCECDVRETKPDDQNDIELVINHDSSYKRIWGVDKNVDELTYEEVKTEPKLSKICTFDEYLECCRDYNMVPYVDIKNVSDIGIQKIKKALEPFPMAYILSYKPDILENFEHSACIIVRDKHNNYKDGLGYGGASIDYKLVNSTVSSFYKNNGLILGVWTLANKASCDDFLYYALVSKKHKIDFVTTNDILW